MTDTRHFYRDLAAFSDFLQLTNESHFTRAPDTWSVVLTDVRGSTKAIKEGRYKDVNLVGAAAISCISNVLESGSFPFVFGGDGATFLISDGDLPLVVKQLRGLQVLAKNEFALELRVGTVSLKRLRELGTDLQVGKYQLSPGNFTAQFKGGGLTLAEDMIKKGTPVGAQIVTPLEGETSPNLAGLSCRLDPLESRNGVVLSVLIKPKVAGDSALLGEILTSLKKILNDDFLSVRPVSQGQLNWRWPPPTMRLELSTQRRERFWLTQWLLTAVGTFVSGMSLKFNIPLGPFLPKRYKSELISNSDFKKFDETLRMTVDCTVEQERAISLLLVKMAELKLITYGLHKSSKAYMTCVVRSAVNNEHIHFIDGGDGGYALAAVQLKNMG